MLFEFPAIEDNGCQLPDAARAKAYAEATDNLGVSKLIKALEIVSQTIGLNCTAIREELSQLRAKGRRLRPLVHFGTLLLISAIRWQKPDRVAELVKAIISSDPFLDPSAPNPYQFEQDATWFSLILQGEMKDSGALLKAITLPAHAVSRDMREHVAQSYRLIAESVPELHEEMTWYVPQIALLETPGFISGSVKTCPGLVFLNVPPERFNATTIAESLIHEAAHHHVFMIEAQDRIVLNDQKELYYSAMTNSERPLMGIFHALVVAARVIWTQDKIKVSPYFRKSGLEYIPAHKAGGHFTFPQKALMLQQTISEHAELTELGRKILESCQAIITERLN